MAGDEQRHQLVAQLAAAPSASRPRGAPSSSIASTSSPLASPSRAALLDQLEDQLVGLVARARAKRPIGPTRPSRAGSGGSSDSGLSPKASIAVSASRSASSRAPALQPEHRAQDDLERQRLQARVQRDRPRRAASARPRARRPRPSGRRARCIFSPWKAGSISLRCSRCGALVEQDHRVRADDRLEDARALAGVQHVGRRREELLDLVGVGEHHERRRWPSRRIVKRLP